jgi:hypothetical protein
MSIDDQIDELADLLSRNSLHDTQKKYQVKKLLKKKLDEHNIDILTQMISNINMNKVSQQKTMTDLNIEMDLMINEINIDEERRERDRITQEKGWDDYYNTIEKNKGSFNFIHKTLDRRCKSTRKPKSKSSPIRKSKSKSTRKPKSKSSPIRKSKSKSTRKPKSKSSPIRKSKPKSTRKPKSKSSPIRKSKSKSTRKPKSKSSPIRKSKPKFL